MPQFLVFLLVALSVIQSPSNYATNKDGKITLFKQAQQYGTLSFIAHNYLAGQYFDDLQIGDDILIIYPDYNQEYEVTEFIKYQALDPTNIYSNFRLDKWHKEKTAAELFLELFDTHDGRLVLMTCYDESKGRLFVIAYPKDDK
jgi:sortase (surface protein transpeptidase)